MLLKSSQRASVTGLRFANCLLQINPTAGDLDGNSSVIIEAAKDAQSRQPELALMGYFPCDLLMSDACPQRLRRTTPPCWRVGLRPAAVMRSWMKYSSDVSPKTRFGKITTRAFGTGWRMPIVRKG